MNKRKTHAYSFLFLEWSTDSDHVANSIVQQESLPLACITRLKDMDITDRQKQHD